MPKIFYVMNALVLFSKKSSFGNIKDWSRILDSNKFC